MNFPVLHRPANPETQNVIDAALIPAGAFLMGSARGAEFERPVAEVFTRAFYLDRHPVTNAEFRVFVDTTGHVTGAESAGEGWGFDGEMFRFIRDLNWRRYAGEDRDQHPVVLVNWHDALAYANWKGKRLPTEAEWEKAARGGGTDEYPWGNLPPDGSQSVFAAAPAIIPPTEPVGCYAANGYGVSEMVGHVWQWCSDWFSEGSYGNRSHRNPLGSAVGTYKVRRGGAWNVIQPFRLRCANRGAMSPLASAPNVGFRCVSDVP